MADLVGSSAAALATPAWAEPFGLVGPEALMCGAPVVGFAVGGLPEIAAQTEGMRLVAPGDVAAMADAVEAVVAGVAQDPRLRASIRASAVSRFSLDARVAALEDVFDSLASPQGRMGTLIA